VSTNEQFDYFLQSKLEKKSSIGTLRTLVHVNGKIDFSSNDYFGFAQSGLLNVSPSSQLFAGSTGSRSITGNSFLAEETERQIALFHKRDAALIFNTGYMANVGFFSCIASKEDTFISDEYIHASIIDGMRLSYANRLRFKHNDLIDLEKKLTIASGRKIVVVESIYSMDGDEAPLISIAALCNKYDALLVVDEAHATGVFGEMGEGIVCNLGLQNQVYACIHTFGKAVGAHGAAITGSKVLRDYLLNEARSFIFTTALPPHLYLQLKAAYQYLPSADRAGLFSLILYFKKTAIKYDSLTFVDSNSPIQGILIGDNFKAKALASHLIENGFFIRAILSPTVPVGKERLRICIHSFNTENQIENLLKTINDFIIN